MHLLGHHLPDHKLVRIALRSFYGISYNTADRLLARLQIPAQATVNSLSEPQVTALSAYLSSPSTSDRPAPTPLSSPSLGPEVVAKEAHAGARDPLDSLQIETDLRRMRKADIFHLRDVGTYRGRRHSMGFPVRGQRTRDNANTAKKLNHVASKKMS